MYSPRASQVTLGGIYVCTYMYMYRRVCIDTSTWDGMYNPMHPRIRELESKRTRTKIAGNAVNRNVLTSIGHTDGQVWLSLPSTLYLFMINWLAHNMFSTLTDWLTDRTEYLTLLAPTQCGVIILYMSTYIQEMVGGGREGGREGGRKEGREGRVGTKGITAETSS